MTHRQDIMIEMIFTKLGCNYLELRKQLEAIERDEFAKLMREVAERKLEASAKELYILPQYKEPHLK